MSDNDLKYGISWVPSNANDTTGGQSENYSMNCDKDLISRKTVKRQFGSLWLKHRLAATTYIRETGDFKSYSKTIAEVIDEVPAADAPHEMSALEFVREHHRMCQSGMECAECRICHDDGEPRSCAVLMGLNPDDTVAIVEKWAREHPEEVE